MPDVTRYRRRRRLALVAATASAVLLVAWRYVGTFPETYSHPALISDGDLLRVFARAGRTHQDDIVQKTLTLDAATLEIKDQSWGYDTRLVPIHTPSGLVGFYGCTWQLMAQDAPLQKLDQEWEVATAAYVPENDSIWIFGQHEGALLARPLTQGVPGAPIEVTKLEAAIDHSVATYSPEGELSIAWSETGHNTVRIARKETERFELLPAIPLGDASQWTAISVGQRLLIITYNRDVQSSSSLTLQVRCCSGCGTPPPPEQWTFRDPFRLFARRVTGMAASVRGDDLYLLLARATALQSTSIPLSSLTPSTDAALQTLRLAPAWSVYVGLLMPVGLLFFALSLVYLGFALLRERRAALAGASETTKTETPSFADPMQRAMAYILDQIFLLPILYLLVEALDLMPDAAPTDLTDPQALVLRAFACAVTIAYFLIQESLWGRTIGKRIVGIRVVDVGADRLTVSRAVTRNLLRCVDAFDIFAIIGLGAILATARRQRIGDLIAGTCVIQDRPRSM